MQDMKVAGERWTGMTGRKEWSWNKLWSSDLLLPASPHLMLRILPHFTGNTKTHCGGSQHQSRKTQGSSRSTNFQEMLFPNAGYLFHGPEAWKTILILWMTQDHDYRPQIPQPRRTVWSQPRKGIFWDYPGHMWASTDGLLISSDS